MRTESFEKDLTMNDYTSVLFQQILGGGDIESKEASVGCNASTVRAFETHRNDEISSYLVARTETAMRDHVIMRITSIVLDKDTGLNSCLKVVQTNGCLCCTQIYMFEFSMAPSKTTMTLHVYRR
jgi:hypothetical protein